MNMHDINKVISALQSFVDRLKADPVAGTIYEGDWDTLIDAQTYLRQLEGQLAFRIDAVTKYQKKVEEQQAEIAELKVMLGHYEDVYEGVVTHPAELTDEDLEVITEALLMVVQMLLSITNLKRRH